jgi:hypothetical protein
MSARARADRRSSSALIVVLVLLIIVVICFTAGYVLARILI